MRRLYSVECVQCETPKTPVDKLSGSAVIRAGYGHVFFDAV